MVFWAIVLVLVGVVMFLAWRKDHKHKVTINRRSGVEADISGGAMFGGDGGSGPTNRGPSSL